MLQLPRLYPFGKQQRGHRGPRPQSGAKPQEALPVEDARATNSRPVGGIEMLSVRHPNKTLTIVGPIEYPI